LRANYRARGAGMKEFEIEAAPDAAPPEFKLGGEEFVCKGEGAVSSLDVLGYVAGMTGDNGLKRIQSVVAIFAAFIPDDDGTPEIDQDGKRQPFRPSSRQRFESLIKRRKVRLALLFEIASYVLDEYLAFPTREEASQSSNGSSTAAPSSGGGSSDLVSVSNG
jgi:hypothetical protein